MASPTTVLPTIVSPLQGSVARGGTPGLRPSLWYAGPSGLPERLEIVFAEKARAPDWEWLGRHPALRYVDLRTVKNVPWNALEAAPSLQTLRISYEMLTDQQGCRRFARRRPDVQIQNGRHRIVIRPGVTVRVFSIRPWSLGRPSARS